MSDKIVSYDFVIDSCVAVKAPYGTNPESLMGQVFVKIIQQARHHELEIRCENTFDGETGIYENIPEKWYEGDENELPNIQ
tara:strand:- start:2353 stop:2595 length:243 start_codon:yes stop_codon:yes gene_type:complete